MDQAARSALGSLRAELSRRDASHGRCADLARMRKLSVEYNTLLRELEDAVYRKRLEKARKIA
tara:strand:+ start:179 stop:367 length:189 start_codon:yes stop_codon:yes gene_type:complete